MPEDRSKEELMQEISRLQKRVSQLEAVTLECRNADGSVQKRIESLSQPMEGSAVAFKDLFNLDDIQRIQDEFAMATGVASIITNPDGTPLTTPSNFTRLCSNIIRNTEKGLLNCYKSDAAIGRHNPAGPIVQPCLSGGLWDAGAAITVGGRHIANWLIGQVRDEAQTEERMRAYAREIGAEEAAFVKAFYEVPSMSRPKFEKIAKMLYTLANQLSTAAYQNIQQTRFIAELKREEELIASSEQRLRAIVDNAEEVIYTLTWDGVFTFVSPAWTRVIGHPVSEVIGRNFVPFVHPDDVEACVDFLKRTRDSGEPQRGVEYRVKKKDGGWAWFTSTGAAMPDARGIPDHYVGVGLDITARKLIEIELRESREKLNMVLDTVPQSIFWKDREGRYLGCNRVFARAAGLDDPSQIIGKTDFDLPWPKEDAEAYIADDREVFENNRPKLHIIEPLQQADGARLWIDTSKVPLFDADGRAFAVLGVYEDITARKRVEEALRDSEEQFRQVFNNMAGGVAIYQAIDSGKDFIFVDINKAAQNSSKVVRDEVVGRRVTEIFPGIVAMGLLEVFCSVWKTGKAQMHPQSLYKDERIQQWVENYVYRLPSGLIVAIYNDITSRKNAEQAMMLAKEQAEQANRYKTEFLTNISHDLRTPLNSILGFASILSSAELGPKDRKALEFINQGARHLLDLVEEILDISKLEYGKIELRSEEFDLHKLLETSVEAFRAAIKKNDVTITLLLGGAIPRIKGDAMRVRQIIDNFLSNAVKYTEQGGIIVAASTELDQPQEEKCRVRISVKDTGIGIPQEKLPYVFDAFTRFHEFYDGKTYDGVGLGLNIVKKLVHFMGGDIHVSSEVGKGSEFVFTLVFDKV